MVYQLSDRRQVQRRSLVSIFDDEKLYSINMIIIKHCSNSLLFIENENCASKDSIKVADL
jgi:hypothetical protein